MGRGGTRLGRELCPSQGETGVIVLMGQLWPWELLPALLGGRQWEERGPGPIAFYRFIQECRKARSQAEVQERSVEGG